MEGRSIFTPAEAEQIRDLLRELRGARAPQQKIIRTKLRRIGLYITDWQQSREGMTVGEFDGLVAIGRIAIED